MKRTGNFKEHELRLREFFFDKETHDGLLGLLGIAGYTIDEGVFCSDTIPKLPSNYCVKFTPEMLEDLPPIRLNASLLEAVSTWEKATNEEMLVINNKNGYASKLNSCLNRILPIDKDIKGTVPITVFLPKKPDIEKGQIIGSRVGWRFYDLDKDQSEFKTVMQYAIQESCEDTSSYFMLRVFLLFKSLGLVDVLKSRTDEKNFFLDLVESVKAKSSFHLVGKDALKDSIKALRGSESKIYKVLPHNPSATTKKFFYTIPINEYTPDSWKREYFEYDDKKYGDFYLLPSLSLNYQKIVEYSCISVGLASKDKKRDIINRANIFDALNIYCSLTKGTAVTFNVPKVNRGNAKKTGINSPMLILPRACYEEALNFKNFRESKDTESTSLSASGMNAQYIKQRGSTLDAVYGPFKGLKNEIIRSFAL